MSLQRNSQRRFQSSTRIELARDLHDSLAQDLVAIGFKLDLLCAHVPASNRNEIRLIRQSVTAATKKVRKELFSLRDKDSDYQQQLADSAAQLNLIIDGEISALSPITRRIVDELVKNAATHSKGHNIEVAITDHLITVKDDGQGLHGVSELVDELGGILQISSTKNGTKVEIRLP